MMKFRTNLVVLLTLFGLFGAGCSYMSISDKDLYVSKSKSASKKAEIGRNNTSIIMGTLKNEERLNVPTLVFAYPENPRKGTDDLENILFLRKPGEYMMYLPKGRFRIFVLIDKNENDLFEANEIAGSFNNQNVLHIKQGQIITEIDLTVSSRLSKSKNLPDNFKIPYVFDGNDYQSFNGQNRKIYDVIFSSKNADTGLWAPTTFLQNFGANIYFLEDFDPKKIPVLFVHGSVGSPQDWAHFLFRLDRTKYQPWFFYYPSGMRLPLIAGMLYEKLIALKEKTGFTKMCLAAHSMGGLITKAMLTGDYYRNNDSFVHLYATFATPWSGFRSADTAVATSPKKLPVWIDMASRSKFIQTQLRKPLPETLDYFLFYGKEDGVSAGKAVDSRVYSGAEGHFSFDVNHQTILTDRAVFTRFQDILNNQFQANEN